MYVHVCMYGCLYVCVYVCKVCIYYNHVHTCVQSTCMYKHVHCTYIIMFNELTYISSGQS